MIPNSNEIDLSLKQSNAFRLLEEREFNHVSEVFYGGAAGGGKSWFGCFWQIYRRLTFPGTRGLIGRSRLKNLKQTTLKTFFEVAKNYFHLVPDVDYQYKQQEGAILFFNGSEIILKDLFLYPADPEFESLGSLEITDAFVDEASEITLKAFEILQSRIRYKVFEVGGTAKILLTSNPSHNWLKFRYVMSEQNTPINLQPYQRFIPALVEDNPDEKFKNQYKAQLMKLNKYDRDRLLHGDWVVNKNEQPFFYEFSFNKHSGQTKINPLEPVWLSFDFNINPTTCIVGQRIEGEGIFIHGCHQLAGGTKRLCDRLQHYKDYILYVTGDFSGNTGNTAAGLLPGGSYNTDFHIIMESLDLTPHNLIDTMTANKVHEYSRRLCNNVFARLPILINGNCQVLLNDLQNAQPTNSGKLRKDRDRHKQDAGDAFRYLINAWFLNGMKDINRFENLLL